MKNPERPHGGIERMRVPDEDAHNWIETLQRGGFSPEEIDMMMVHLNDTYAREKLGRFIEDEVRIANDMFERRRGKAMTEDERERVREFVFERLRKISLADLEKGVRVSYDKEQE